MAFSRKSVLTLLVLACSSPAAAWYEHAHLMPYMVSEEALSFGDLAFTGEMKSRLKAPIGASCGTEDQTELRRLESLLQLHAGTKFGPTSAAACAEKRPTTGLELLSGSFVDDPDKGMDANLPDTFDPTGERDALRIPKTGSGSQGFRHVYFHEWSIAHPIATFHLPKRALGIAPKRLELLAAYARADLPKPRAHSYRVLGWALHYIQDLSQPFHVVSVPSPTMGAWYALWTWPPSKGVADLAKETDRSVTNYHWAIEGYVRNRAQEKGDKNPFVECLTQSANFATLDRTSISTPRELADAVSRASVALAPELGSRAVAFFGRDLRLRDRDFSKGYPQPNYSEMAITPDLEPPRAKLHETLCKCLANGAWASRWLIRYALGSG